MTGAAHDSTTSPVSSIRRIAVGVFVLSLRLLMDVAFLIAGLDELPSGSFTAAGYLTGAVPANAGPFVDRFLRLANSPAALAFVDAAVPFDQLAIGLVVVALVRLGTLFVGSI